MALKQNTWKLNQWYDQDVAGNVTYTGVASLFAWGRNNNAQLGQNNKTSYSSPVQVPGTTWQYLSHMSKANDSDHALATKTDGTLWAWGNNGKGQLGQNSEVKYSSPIQIPGTDWGQYMETSGSSSFAIRTDGTLWAWGLNESGYGRLGLNNKTSYSSPTQIPGTTWSKINANGFSTMATKTDGTLWTWGQGNVGQLAQNNQTNYSSPKQVPGTTWPISDNQMSGGNNWQTAIKTDGTLWVWGYNQFGQLGQGEAGTGAGGLGGAKSSPIQVGSDTTWSKITSTRASAAAVKTDGTLWSWGQNTFGQLGHNNTTHYSSPTQAPGTTWSNVTAISQSIIAVKTDATMWSWGYDQFGELGLNESGDSSRISSPTQLAGDWKQGVRQMGSTMNGFMAIGMV